MINKLFGLNTLIKIQKQKKIIQFRKRNSKMNTSGISGYSGKSADKSVNKGTLEDYIYIPNEKGTSDLGKGAYGIVKLCQNRNDNKKYAMKIVIHSI